MSADPIVDTIIHKFLVRSADGMRRYGVSLDQNPKQPLEWLEDAQEELMDAILYMEALKQSLRSRTPSSAIEGDIPESAE